MSNLRTDEARVDLAWQQIRDEAERLRMGTSDGKETE